MDDSASSSASSEAKVPDLDVFAWHLERLTSALGTGRLVSNAESTAWGEGAPPVLAESAVFPAGCKVSLHNFYCLKNSVELVEPHADFLDDGRGEDDRPEMHVFGEARFEGASYTVFLGYGGWFIDWEMGDGSTPIVGVTTCTAVGARRLDERYYYFMGEAQPYYRPYLQKLSDWADLWHYYLLPTLQDGGDVDENDLEVTFGFDRTSQPLVQFILDRVLHLDKTTDDDVKMADHDFIKQLVADYCALLWHKLLPILQSGERWHDGELDRSIGLDHKNALIVQGVLDSVPAGEGVENHPLLKDLRQALVRKQGKQLRGKGGPPATKRLKVEQPAVASRAPPAPVATTVLTNNFFMSRYPKLIGKLVSATDDDDADDPFAADDDRFTVTLPDETLMVDGEGREYVDRLTLTNADDKQVELRVGDFVRVAAPQRCVFRVVHLWTDERREQCRMHAVQLQSVRQTAIAGECGRAQELVYAYECAEELDAEDVVAVVRVAHRPPPAADEWRRTTSEQRWHAYTNPCEPGDFFVSQCYDSRVPSLFYDAASLDAVMAADIHSCHACLHRLRTDAREGPTFVGADKLLVKGILYERGDGVYLSPSAVSLEHARPATPLFDDEATLKEGMRKFRDPSSDKDLELVYPEVDRWLGYSKHKDAKDRQLTTPLHVAVISDIDANERTVTARLLYRSANTAMKRRLKQTANPHELFLSQEAVEVSLSDEPCILGRCAIRSVDAARIVAGSDEREELEAWLLAGDDRFYCAKALDASTALPSADVEWFAGDKAIFPTTFAKYADYADLGNKIHSLDLFAGVGGLSCGMHLANLTDTKWAVEYEAPHARAFQRNFPSATVFRQDVNVFLRDVINGKARSADGQEYPRRGDVHMIKGGPPCQGFSGLNSSKHMQAALMQRTRTASFMSANDFFQPDLVLMENVGGLSMKADRVTLVQVLMECLRAIGYQVSIRQLDAAQYGVPQRRQRIFIYGAAPGMPMMQWPLPTTGCERRCVAPKENLKLNGQVFDSPSWLPTERGAAPLPAVTVRDAISNLPKVRLGSAEDDVAAPPPLSWFQKQLSVRWRTTTGKKGYVDSHVPKEQQPLNRKRIELVPTYPVGADWTFLPNIKVTLIDNSLAIPLLYSGQAEIYRKRDGQAVVKAARAVCSCGNQSRGKCGERRAADEKRTLNTLIPWCLPHTAARRVAALASPLCQRAQFSKQQWIGLIGRVYEDAQFDTIITTVVLTGKQGRVIHPREDRTMSVREMARGQAFPDEFSFRDAGANRQADRYEQVGNAVPPLLARAIGRKIAQALADHDALKNGA